MILWLPTDKLDVVKIATPELLTGTTARTILPSLNVTVPALTVLELLTVAVSVTEEPDSEGFRELVNVVVVIILLTC